VTVPERPDLTAGAVVLNRGALRDNTMAEVRAVLQRFNNPARTHTARTQAAGVTPVGRRGVTRFQ